MGKKTAQELRAKAKQLLKQAEELEKERAVKIGQAVLEIIEAGKPFTAEDIKFWQHKIKKRGFVWR